MSFSKQWLEITINCDVTLWGLV